MPLLPLLRGKGLSEKEGKIIKVKGIEFENLKLKSEYLDPSLGFERKELFF